MKVTVEPIAGVLRVLPEGADYGRQNSITYPDPDAGGSLPAITVVQAYDSSTGLWSGTGAMATARYVHTATLLPNGKLLVAGGYGATYLSSAELYDVGLGFTNSWQP